MLGRVQPAYAGDDAVVVTNRAGSVTSSVARLTVISPGRFTNLAYSPGNGFSFFFRAGSIGTSYRIQTAQSLAPDSWMDWMNLDYAGPIGLTDFSALEATNRFYRAVSP